MVFPNQSRFLQSVSVFAVLYLTGLSSDSFGHGAYHDVVAELNAKLATNPNDADLRFRLAAAHVEHGEWKACLEEVGRIEELAPGEFSTAYLTGKALAGEGMLEPALVKLNDFLAGEPAHQGALVERARVHLKLGQVDASCADYASALAMPATSELYVEAVEALRRNGRAADSLTLAKIGLEKTGDDPAMLLCAVECSVSLNRIDDALLYLEKLERKWPRPEPWMQRKAEILEEADRGDEALAAWRELHDHILALPNLDRAQPFLAELFAQSRRALGLENPAAVIAPPAR